MLSYVQHESRQGEGFLRYTARPDRPDMPTTLRPSKSLGTGVIPRTPLIPSPMDPARATGAPVGTTAVGGGYIGGWWCGVVVVVA